VTQPTWELPSLIARLDDRDMIARAKGNGTHQEAIILLSSFWATVARRPTPHTTVGMIAIVNRPLFKATEARLPGIWRVIRHTNKHPSPWPSSPRHQRRLELPRSPALATTMRVIRGSLSSASPCTMIFCPSHQGTLGKEAF